MENRGTCEHTSVQEKLQVSHWKPVAGFVCASITFSQTGIQILFPSCITTNELKRTIKRDLFVCSCNLDFTHGRKEISNLSEKTKLSQ